MARYTDESRERVRDAVDFVELVGARTELRRAGPQRYQGLCPFHDERTPSFGIDPSEKLYYCFGCGKGGDVFSFVMETENLRFSEALELLAERFNVPLEQDTEDPRAAERRAERDRLLGLLERTAAWYVRMLWETPEAQVARDYIRERGLDEGILREFRVGFSPPAWDRVVSASQRAGYSARELWDAGLASRSRDESRLLDRFRGRLMFPLADRQGRVIGFGARSLSPDDQPKYLNSSENRVFSKGRELFGTHLARSPAAKAAAVILAEGYTDVVALHQAGVRNSVAAMGTALTEQQATLLISLAPRVLLCLDADAAGYEAMVKAESAIRAAARRQKDVEVLVVPLPPGRDPADILVGEGVEEMRSLLARAVPFTRFEVDHALRTGDVSSAEGRDRVLDRVERVIRPLPRSVLKEELVQLVAGRLGLSEGLVAERLERPAATAAAPVRPEGPRFAIDGRVAAERDFLGLCIAFPARGREALADAGIEDLLAAPLHRRAVAHLRDHLDAPAAGLSDDPDLSTLVAELVMRGRAAEEGGPTQLDRALLILRRQRLDRTIAAARLEGGPVLDLAAERQRIVAELEKLPG